MMWSRECVSEWLGCEVARLRGSRLRGCKVARFEVARLQGCEVRGCKVARLRGSKFFIYRLMTFFWTALYVVIARLRGCEVARLNYFNYLGF